MLTSVEARNKAGSLLVMELEDISDGIILEDVDGIAPVKAQIVSSNFAQLPGAIFQNARREPRNLIIKLGLEPGPASSVAALRAQLYSYFMPKSEVNLRFVTTTKTVEATGIVEDFVSPVFVKEPFADIYILCHDPDFISLSDSEFYGDSVNNPTLYEEIVYPGTVETGFYFEMTLDRSIDSFAIYNSLPDGTQQILNWNSGSLSSGDIIKISTIARNKYAMVELSLDHTDTDFLYAVSAHSQWPQLFPGVNRFRVYIPGDPIPFSITYRPRYGGL